MSRDLVKMDMALPVGSLSAYINWTNHIPMLSAEEELDLATRLQASGDIEAARRLVMSHLRFVVRMTRNYLGYGLSHADLIQEGNIGLMKAVKRFKPEKGVRLISFAAHWIKAEVHEFILRNWRVVKVATTKAQRKLFFNLRKFSREKESLRWLTESEVNMIAQELSVTPDDVRTMEMRMPRHDKSFDGFLGDDGGDDDGGSFSLSPADYLGDEQLNPAHQLEQCMLQSDNMGRLQSALAALKPRERDIVQQRWLAEKKSNIT